MRYEKMNEKKFRYYDVTFWNFCIIVMRKDCFCPPAELADFRRKKSHANTCGGDKKIVFSHL